MAWQYFYWSETFTNRAGESLRVCLDKYGVRVDSMEEIGVTSAILFLSSSKALHDSWLLTSTIGGEEIKVKYYEADPATYHLSPSTDLGTKIAALLNRHTLKTEMAEKIVEEGNDESLVD